MGTRRRRTRRALPPRQRILDALILIVSISIVSVGALTIALIRLGQFGVPLDLGYPVFLAGLVALSSSNVDNAPALGGRLTLARRRRDDCAVLSGWLNVARNLTPMSDAGVYETPTTDVRF